VPRWIVSAERQERSPICGYLRTPFPAEDDQTDTVKFELAGDAGVTV